MLCECCKKIIVFKGYFVTLGESEKTLKVLKKNVPQIICGLYLLRGNISGCINFGILAKGFVATLYIYFILLKKIVTEIHSSLHN